MMVWIAWKPPLYTHSTSHSRWTRNQRATSVIFGRSTQNTWMKKRKPQKQGLTGLDFEINVKNCQKMSKNAKNRENWSFSMSCSSETSMVRGGFFYIVSKIMHERTTTESLVTIARWFFSNYKVALHLKIKKVSRIGAEREKADGISLIVLYPNRKLLDRQVRVFRRSSWDLVLSVQGLL